MRPFVRNATQVLCRVVLVGCTVAAALAAQAQEGRKPASFYEKKFSINFRNTDVKDALTLIANKGDLKLRTQGDMSGKVNYAMRDSTLEDALEHIAEENDISYKLSGGTIFVSQRSQEAAPSGPGPGAAVAAPAAPSEDSSLEFGSTYRSLPISYATAKEMIGTISPSLKKGETIVADEANNSLILFSSSGTYEQVKSFVGLYDRRPPQILIEAQIIESTKTFARQLGFIWGDTAPQTGVAPSMGGGITTGGVTNANLVLRSLLGTIDGRALEARLIAAESDGTAKIVSRPKLFTLNNRKATLHSGITYHIKTLSTVSGGGTGTGGGTGGGTEGAATGGVKTITSGLQLDVTPTIVGDSLIRLSLKVSNSTPNAAGVDGIPGITDNSAETAILVKGGQTAAMAGLLKNDVSDDKQGAPWFSSLPVIGWLFRSSNKRDFASEMMIFITPRVVDAIGNGKPVDAEPKETDGKARLPAAQAKGG